MAASVLAQSHTVASGKTTEHTQVEIDQRLTFGPKTLVRLAGFNFDYGLNGGHLDIHLGRYLDKIIFGQTPVPVLGRKFQRYCVAINTDGIPKHVRRLDFVGT